MITKMQGARLSKGIWKSSSCKHCCATPKSGYVSQFFGGYTVYPWLTNYIVH